MSVEPSDLNIAMKPSNVWEYICSPKPGASTLLTIINQDTGNRITVQIQRPKENPAYPNNNTLWISVLTGPDNETSYSFVGSIGFYGILKISHKTKVSPDLAQRVKLILDWTIGAAEKGDLKTVEVLRSNTCGRCARTLTTPDSIQRGIGPVCLETLGLS